jgi:hypothetical protein
MLLEMNPHELQQKAVMKPRLREARYSVLAEAVEARRKRRSEATTHEPDRSDRRAT